MPAVQLPHLFHFESAYDIFKKISMPMKELLDISEKMRRKNAVDLTRHLKFWKEAFLGNVVCGV